MDAQEQKHRMIRWLRSMAAVLLLVAFWGAQAAVDVVPPIAITTWCIFPWNVGGVSCVYTSVLAAAQAQVANDAAGPAALGYPPILEVMSNCRADGICDYNYNGFNTHWWVPSRIQSGCPVPTVNPSVPYLYNSTTGMCERSSLTITLSGGTEVEPSKGAAINTLPFIATVKDQGTGQPPSTSVTVKISLKVDDQKSGGHDHGTSDRPRGGVGNVGTCRSDDTCWSWDSPANNGVVVFNFNPTETSGKYTISATCDKCSNTETAKVNVKVKEANAADWGNLTASSDYALVGGETGKKHSDNHYLTATARDHLQKLVYKYNAKYPQGPVLYLNDASLEWGGKFDIQGKWDKDSAHKNHRRGVVIDVRANQDPTAIPQARFNDFEKFAKKSEAYADLHCAFSGPYVCPACLLDTGPNRHYHIRLLGQGIDR